MNQLTDDMQRAFYRYCRSRLGVRCLIEYADSDTARVFSIESRDLVAEFKVSEFIKSHKRALRAS